MCAETEVYAGEGESGALSAGEEEEGGVAMVEVKDCSARLVDAEAPSVGVPGPVEEVERTVLNLEEGVDCVAK